MYGEPVYGSSLQIVHLLVKKSCGHKKCFVKEVTLLFQVQLFYDNEQTSIFKYSIVCSKDKNTNMNEEKVRNLQFRKQILEFRIM